MTKKLLAVIFCCLFSTYAFAQISQGTKVLRGSLSAGAYRGNSEGNDYAINSESQSFNIGINPSIGYFVKDDIEIGTGISLNYYSGKGKTTNWESKITSYGLGIFPYLKKYYSLTDRLFFHGTASVSFDSDRSTQTSDSEFSTSDIKFKTTSYGAGIYPGLTYFATEKFALNTSFGSLAYQRSTVDREGQKNTYQNYGVNLTLSSLTFGVSYFISR